jgi:hypothetical protein
MSFNQPPPQPGYGPPQQPNPYGPPPPQQPAPAPQGRPAPGAPGGAPGYPQGYPPQGYPQQPQATPYGYPPQQQPLPPQPGRWGPVQAPVPPGPQGGGSGKGKVIGLVAGAVAVVAAIGVGAALMLGGGGGGDDYKLSMPPSILGGAYAKSTSTSPGLSNGQVGSSDGISDATTVSGQYGKTGGEQYTISGAYGKVGDPAKVVDMMLNSMKATTGGGSSAAQEVHPAGFDGTVMKCNMMSKTIPYCVWGDDSTVGLVLFADTSSAALTGGNSAKYPTIQDFAGDAAKIRSEIRVKK